MRSLLATAALIIVSGIACAETPVLQPAYDMSLSRDEKVKLAEGAAPPEVSRDATVYALEPSGYVKVRDGSNGFTCLVDRQSRWSSEPACFDAEGSATLVPSRLFAEAERAKGATDEQIDAALDEGFRSGRFNAPRKPGIVYMLSDSVFVFAAGKVVHGPPHLMFYLPYGTSKDLGSPPRGAGMPFLIREGRPDTFIIVVPGAATHSGH